MNLKKKKKNTKINVIKKALNLKILKVPEKKKSKTTRYPFKIKKWI